MPSRHRRAVPPARRTVMAVVGGLALTGLVATLLAVDIPGARAAGPEPAPSPTAAPPTSTPALPLVELPGMPGPAADPVSVPSSVPSPVPSPPPADRVDTRWPRTPPWDACPRPVWPGQRSVGTPGSGRRVLVIGDSLTRESRAATARAMRASGWTPTFRCWGSRRLDWGLDQVHRARQIQQLPAFVIVALGTNDISWETPATTQRRARALLDRLGPNRHVLWVDLHLTRSTWLNARADWFNGMLRDLAREYPSLTVVDWHRQAVAKGIRGWDGIHYGPSGYRHRAVAVARALDEVGQRHPAAAPEAPTAPSASAPSG